MNFHRWQTWPHSTHLCTRSTLCGPSLFKRVCMDLLSLLVALAFDQTNRHHTGKRFLTMVADWLCGGWGVAGLAALVSAVFLCHVLLRTLSPIVGGLFGAVLLVLCLGMGELAFAVRGYLDMRVRDDEEGARHIASALAGRDVCSAGVRLTREMLAVVLVEGHARGIGVLFWYLVLGPAGALAAALVRPMALPNCQAMEKSAPIVGKVCWAMDWLPARISALCYGVAGSLTHALGNWRSRAWKWDEHNTAVLVASGTGALLLETETSGDSLPKATPEAQDATVEGARDLVMRALVVWVIAVALITLGGWLKQ